MIMALVYKTKYAAAVNTRNLFSNTARSTVQKKYS